MDKLRKAYIKYGLIFSFLGIITKLIFWKLNLLTDNADYSAMSYLLFLLLAIFFTLLEFKRTATKIYSYVDELKYGMRSVGVFAIVVSSFTYIYYANIDPTFFATRTKERIELAQKVDLATIKSPKKLTREVIVANEVRLTSTFYDPKNHSGITLFLFTFVGLLYCTLIVGIMRLIGKIK